MVQGKWFAPGQPLGEVLPVREAVFGAAGPESDPLSWNCLVFWDGVPAAAGRIWWQDGAFRIGDIGVLPDYRGRGLGDLALRLLLFKAQSHAAREVRLKTPPELAGFFARLGFRAGAPEEGGAETLEMMIPGDAIDLDTCRNCPRQDCPSRK
ncbi:MAG: GNAT family N-acetyltransferase [Clostridia bacterium]|nr:GNAT family N-acetyltransferase [Clostridia bacterium]